MNRKRELLLEIVQLVGYQYISDLRCNLDILPLDMALKRIRNNRYSLLEWNQAARYLYPDIPWSDQVEDLKQMLEVRTLALQRKRSRRSE